MILLFSSQLHIKVQHELAVLFPRKIAFRAGFVQDSFAFLVSQICFDKKMIIFLCCCLVLQNDVFLLAYIKMCVFLLNCNTMLILFTIQSRFSSLFLLLFGGMEDAQLFTSILLVVCS